jgi:uncharacterized membrane protein
VQASKIAEFPVKPWLEWVMIEQQIAVSGEGLQLILRPRRALTARQFMLICAVIALLTWAVALASYSQGNVFAPLFALLDTLIVALALRWVWVLGERYELITLNEQHLQVKRSSQPQHWVFDAHPYWVRMQLEKATQGLRVILQSQGKEIEVGSFLAPDERSDLAERLKTLLAQASHRA